MESIFLPKQSPPHRADDIGTKATLAAQPKAVTRLAADDPAPAATSPLLPREVFDRLPQPQHVFWRRPFVERITGLPTPTLYRYMKLGLFPRPHRLGPNTVGWLSTAVEAWCASRAET